MKKWLPIILILFMITSCAVKKIVKSTYETTYTTSENQKKALTKEAYRFYCDSFKVHNEINYGQSNEIEYLDFNRDTPGYKRSFGMMWDSPETLRRTGDPYKLEDGKDSLGSYLLSHSANDWNGMDIHVFFESLNDNFYRVETYSDSLKIDRSVKLSREVIDYYLGIKRMLADSLEHQALIPFPDMKKCTTLISSTYEKLECISKQEGLFKRTYIDSSYYDGELEIEQEEDFITDLKTVAPNGDVKAIYKEGTKHINQFYKADDLANPYSATQSFIAAEDTFYTIDLTTQFENGLRRSNYVIREKKKDQGNTYGNLRLPLVHKEINIWRDIKTGEIVRTRNWARTSEGHILEIDKGKNGKVLKEKLILPEISKDQKYPIGFYPFYRLEIARYDKGYRKPKVEKDLNVYYEDFKKKLEPEYERIASDKASMKEVWLSKDALKRVDLELR